MREKLSSFEERRRWTMAQWRAEMLANLPALALPLILIGSLLFFWGASRSPLNDALFRTDKGHAIAKQACASIVGCSALKLEMRYDRSAHEWERVARVTGKNLEPEVVFGAIEESLHANTRSPIYNWAFTNIKIEFTN